MNAVENITVAADETGMRLDRWFKVALSAVWASDNCRSCCVRDRSAWTVAG